MRRTFQCGAVMVAAAFSIVAYLQDSAIHAADASGARAAFEARWFAANSPWNTPIAENTETLDGSKDFIAAFLESDRPINLNTEVWTPTVLYASADLPRCELSESEWRIKDFPMHPEFLGRISYFASRGDTDASFCVYSETNQSFYNLWNVQLITEDGQSRVQVGALGVFPVGGAGWWDNSIGPWIGRASGASYCGGLVRTKEAQADNIDHALSIGWPAELIRQPGVLGSFVFPARTTDGKGRDAQTAVPMGARLQLDKTLSEDQLLTMGVKRNQLPIVRAMQRYGAYVVDSSSTMAIYVESNLGTWLSPTRSLGNLPRELLSHARFVEPPKKTPLDTRFSVGQPVRDVRPPDKVRQCTAQQALAR